MSSVRKLPQILLVDNEPAVLGAVSQLLVRLRFEPTTAATGAEALARIASGVFEIVLSDLYLGDMTAFDLLDRAGGSAAIAMFVMTGYATIETAIAATRAGARGYLEKPITPDALRAVLVSGHHGFMPVSDAAAPSRSYVHRAIAFIERNYSAKDLSVVIVAARVAISPDHLGRLFRKHVGCSILVFIHRTRLRHAKQLLKDHSLSVKEIADLCGYRSTAQIDRHFVRLARTSPTAYRRSSGVVAGSDSDYGKPETDQ